jgi:hypothetical protein
VAPQSPAFTTVAPGTNQLDLAWTIPLDQGVNIAPDSTESAGSAGNLDSQNWYRVGDVGVQLSRDASVISAWGTSTAWSDTGLVPNTPYSYTLEAHDNHTGLRGNWHNSTTPQSSTVWTLSLLPGPGSVAADVTNAVPGTTVNWTAVGGFGVGKVQYYRYVWDQLPTHSFDDTETQWSAGTLPTVPNASGLWYLHVKGYNGADFGNGAFDYAISVAQPQPQLLSIVMDNGDVTLTWRATAGSTYRVQYAPDLGSLTWTDLVPDVQANGPTAFAMDHTGGATQRFYRIMLVP